jgi:hypothetical protein
MSTGAVQFKGKDAAMRAFEYNKIPNWALYVGRELLTSYTGRSMKDATDALDQFLDMLKDHNSAGTYQLRMYHDLKVRVNNTTPYTNSFKFKLLDDEEYEGGGGSQSYRLAMQRMDRIEALLTANAEGEGEDDEEEEPVGVMGHIQNAIVEKLKDPQTMNFLMGKVIGLIGSFTGTPQPAASMNGQPTTLPNDQAYLALAPEQREALDRAMCILMNGDPSIGTNLEKLAKILAADPGKYAGLAAMI